MREGVATFELGSCRGLLITVVGGVAFKVVGLLCGHIGLFCERHVFGDETLLSYLSTFSFDFRARKEGTVGNSRDSLNFSCHVDGFQLSATNERSSLVSCVEFDTR